MEMWSLLLRTVLIYCVVFLIMRFMGKREIGRLSVFDLVISVMIAEIAVVVIEDVNRPIADGILPMAVLLAIQLGISYIIMKNRKLRLLFDGKPSVIMAGGKLNKEEMKKQRYNLDDLMLQLRENKISAADVEFAILETTGKLSVIEKPFSREGQEGSPEETEDKQEKQEGNSILDALPSKYRYEVLPIPLIMDGKVQDQNLEKLQKTRFWLKNVLQEQGVKDFKDVFLCTIDYKGKLFVDMNRTPPRQ